MDETRESVVVLAGSDGPSCRRHGTIDQGRTVHVHVESTTAMTPRRARAHIRRDFRQHLGRTPRLRRPRTFNEKIQWLKLHHHDDLLTRCADKLAMRDYVAERCGPGYTVPVIRTFERADTISRSELPESFVLKVNNGSGDNVFVRPGSTISDAELQAIAEQWISGPHTYWMKHAEWAYKNIPPLVFAEEFIDAEVLPTDYKVWCFNGVPRAILVVRGRGSGTGVHRDFVTPEWQPMRDVRVGTGSTEPERPGELDELLAISRMLAEPFPFVRVDCYLDAGQVFVGELTFYPSAGLEPFADDHWDEVFGEALTLPPRMPARWRD